MSYDPNVELVENVEFLKHTYPIEWGGDRREGKEG